MSIVLLTCFGTCLFKQQKHCRNFVRHGKSCFFPFRDGFSAYKFAFAGESQRNAEFCFRMASLNDCFKHFFISVRSFNKNLRLVIFINFLFHFKTKSFPLQSTKYYFHLNVYRWSARYNLKFLPIYSYRNPDAFFFVQESFLS